MVKAILDIMVNVNSYARHHGKYKWYDSHSKRQDT